MELFTILEDEFAILRRKGVYKQAKLYRRGSKLFAGVGAGFIRLHKENVTSDPNTTWLDASVSPDPIGGRNGTQHSARTDQGIR